MHQEEKHEKLTRQHEPLRGVPTEQEKQSHGSR
jgi:hypothetical protein